MKVIVKKKILFLFVFFGKKVNIFFFIIVYLVREDNFCIRIVKYKFM